MMLGWGPSGRAFESCLPHFFIIQMNSFEFLNLNRIAIIGSGGSGKSTLAKMLALKLNLPLHHLDCYFWNPNWIHITKEELKHIQIQIINEEYWIFDGNYTRTMDVRLNAADTIIYLDFPRRVCMWRILKRFFMYRKKIRTDITEGCKEQLELEFVRFVWNFQKKKRPLILEKLRNLPENKEVFILCNQKAVNLFIKSIS